MFLVRVPDNSATCQRECECGEWFVVRSNWDFVVGQGLTSGRRAIEGALYLLISATSPTSEDAELM